MDHFYARDLVGLLRHACRCISSSPRPASTFMTRSLRNAHRVVWVALALALILGLAAALVFRAPAHAATFLSSDAARR